MPYSAKNDTFLLALIDSPFQNLIENHQITLMKILRFILNLLLTIAICVVGYFLFLSIKEPIDFERESNLRKDAVITKLKKIRSAQLAHKDIHGRFCGDFDTLINMIKTDSFNVMKVIGDPNDSTVVVTQEMVKVSMLDSLFEEQPELVDALPKVPYTKDADFDIDARMITKNEVEVPAFEVSVPYEILYDGLIKKYYQDKVGYDLKVGDIYEGTTSGNWEK